MRILIICTGNSRRSQMAEGFLRKYMPGSLIFSAGTRPADEVNPNAIKVMLESGIDISSHKPRSINEYTEENFDYVITVCDGAKEVCPVFSGGVRHRMHIGFEDPAEAIGTEEEILNFYRKIRDEIKNRFLEFSLTAIEK